MSLRTTLQNQTDNAITALLTKVATQFSLDVDLVLAVYYEDAVPLKKKVVPAGEPIPDNEYTNMAKTDLASLCKERNLPVSGTKQKLIERLLAGGAEVKEKVVVKAVKSAVPPAIKKLVDSIPSVVVKRNSFGNFIHEATGLVMRSASQLVYGKQRPDGSVAPLGADDIDLCHKFKFKYELPITENLDRGNDAKIATDKEMKELDESENEEIFVEEEELMEDDEEIEIDMDSEGVGDEDPDEECYYEE